MIPGWPYSWPLGNRVVAAGRRSWTRFGWGPPMTPPRSPPPRSTRSSTSCDRPASGSPATRRSWSCSTPAMTSPGWPGCCGIFRWTCWVGCAPTGLSGYRHPPVSRASPGVPAGTDPNLTSTNRPLTRPRMSPQPVTPPATARPSPMHGTGVIRSWPAAAGGTTTPVSYRFVEGTLIRLTVDRLPGDRQPKPLWMWSSATQAHPSRRGPPLAGVSAPVRHRTHLPTTETDSRVDQAPAAYPQSGRPMDLADHRRAYPTAAGPRPHHGPAPSPIYPGCPRCYQSSMGNHYSSGPGSKFSLVRGTSLLRPAAGG
jgi:hypothetical protein